jgi:hypothetical protein
MLISSRYKKLAAPASNATSAAPTSTFFMICSADLSYRTEVSAFADSV